MKLFRTLFGKPINDNKPFCETLPTLETAEINELDERESQEKRILTHLEADKSINALEALKLYQCFRLSDRIFTLRKKGYNIKTEMLTVKSGKKVGNYTLIKEK